MNTDFHTYCGLIYRAAGHDLAALNQAYELMDDPRTHAQMMLRGSLGVLGDLQAVTLCRLMQASGEHLRVTPDVLAVFRNAVVQELFPQVRELCQSEVNNLSLR